MIAATFILTLVFVLSLYHFTEDNYRILNAYSSMYVVLVFGLIGGAVIYRMYYDLHKQIKLQNETSLLHIQDLIQEKLEPTILFRRERGELQASVATNIEQIQKRENASDFIRFFGSGSLQPSQEELERLPQAEKDRHGATRYSNAFANFLNPDVGGKKIHRYVRLFPTDTKLPRNDDLKNNYLNWILSQADLFERNKGAYYFTNIQRAPEFAAPVSYIATSTSFFVMFGSGENGLEIRGENIASRAAGAIKDYFGKEPGDTTGTPMTEVTLRKHAEEFDRANKLGYFKKKK